MTRRPLGLTSCLMLALASACGGGGGQGGAETPRRAPRGVVLLSIDTLRADRLGCYGYDRPTSPYLDAVAAAGVRFSDVTSTSSWTVPAHASMLTGLFPSEHGVDGWNQKLSDGLWRLPLALRDEGFRTAAIVNVGLIGADRGFASGFEHFEEVPPSKVAEGSAEQIFAWAERWLRDHADERFFLFVHVYDVHASYQSLEPYEQEFVRPYEGEAEGTTRRLKGYQRKPDPPWGPAEARYLGDLYDAGIRQLDESLGGFLRRVRADLGGVAWVITSDHGEEFLERGGVLHGANLHREVARVPLLVFGPGVPAGRVVDVPASLVDLPPTLLSLLGFDPGDVPGEGIDLTPLWQDDVPPAPARPLWAGVDKWFLSEEGDLRRTLRRGHWVLHYEAPSGEKRLYDLSRDPGETTDRFDSEPEIAARLWAELEAYMAGESAAAEEIELSEEELDELRALGYR